MHEHLYEVMENVNVKFIGFATEQARYDFGIIYTSQFFGKPLVVCMQTGRSTLLCIDDAMQPEHIKRAFNIADWNEAENVTHFFKANLPTLPLVPQY
ncbi:DUF3055 domain-containing protein [Anaerobacillus sp. MEB173]|uniref:DUF3055 domain-containing protein n=1 Tax=Anaerobacillus sp. MEB173 TaxID=3383345 RepID=UPI003F906B5A